MSIGGKVKMSVTIKTVGKERIHVKESMTTPKWCDFVILMSIPLVFINVGYTIVVFDKISQFENLIGFVTRSAVLIAMLLFLMYRVVDKTPAYYVDTSMYGVGGKTIIKTNPADDRAAICEASREFELQMLERIANEIALETLVDKCK